jgi:FixJ family two-component response regulator
MALNGTTSFSNDAKVHIMSKMSADSFAALVRMAERLCPHSQ